MKTTSNRSDTSVAGQLGLVKIRATLSDYIEKEICDDRVLNTLLADSGCPPVEGELLDYKLRLEESEIALAKCAVQIVSLHNTYGGFLIFGVEETRKDQHFEPRGIALGAIKLQQIRVTIRNYTGRAINVSYRDVSVRWRNQDSNLGVLLVPKRPVNVSPVQFGKAGPSKDTKPLFNAGDVFFRLQDQNARAQSNQDWWFLASERQNPYISPQTLPVPLIGTRRKILDENLPDRNLICPRFVGRNDVIVKLWNWLSDDLQYGKLLAGDGGKGKSSIAYEFAEEIIRSKPYDFEKVLWLTAKKEAFRALKDEYDPVEAHFSSYEELLRVLCERLAILPEEIKGSSTDLLKRTLRESLQEIHTFVVIDDVDSLDPDEQRMVLETAVHVGNSRSRFLLTTRKNFTYSDDLCLAISGFDKTDYIEYVQRLEERFGDISLSLANIEKLRNATDGSPLYTESLVRLIRNKMPINTAIARWKGELGMKVRRAALGKEIKNVSEESRQVLLATVYLYECSYTELRQVTKYVDEQLNQCIDELKSLFLVAAPRVISTEARFSVQSNTRMLVLASMASERTLVKNPTGIREACEKLRRGKPSLRSSGQRRTVASAITQANAFLREGDTEKAIATLATALRTLKHNPDLLFMLAKSHLAKEPPRYDIARQVLRNAYESGQRKYQLYDAWYECELDSDNAVGAIEVARLAIENESTDKVEWRLKCANALKKSSARRVAEADIFGAIADLKGCDAELRVALPLCRKNQVEEIHAGLMSVGLDLMALSQRHEHDVAAWRNEFGILREISVPSMHRVAVAERLTLCVENIVSIARHRESLSQGLCNLIDMLLRELRGYIRAQGIDSDRVDPRLESRVTKIALHFETMCSEVTTVAKVIESPVARDANVFLAHNSRDKEIVGWISEKLEEVGVSTWLDEKDVPPGQLFQDFIQKALRKGKVIAVFIGPNGLGKWQAFELRTAISEAVEKEIAVIPVFLPNAKDVSGELPFLMEFNCVKFKEINDPRALDLLISAIRYRQSSSMYGQVRP